MKKSEIELKYPKGQTARLQKEKIQTHGNKVTDLVAMRFDVLSVYKIR